MCFLFVGNRGKLHANFEIPKATKEKSHAENLHWKICPWGAPMPEGDVPEIEGERGIILVAHLITIKHSSYSVDGLTSCFHFRFMSCSFFLALY